MSTADHRYSTETQALLERFGEGKLTRKAAAELAASGISPDVAALRGYASIARDKAHSVLCVGYKFADWQAKGAGLLLPTWDVFGKQAGAMFKPDSPRKENGKNKIIKYETPAASRLILDCPPMCKPDLGKPDVDLFVTEGVKKGDSLASHGRCAIALTGGVWGWLGTNSDGGKTALSDWREVALDGRKVFVAFDSDVAENPAVARAQAELAAYLTSRGAKVLIIRIPTPEDGEKKRGVDDFLATGGDLDELILQATPAASAPTNADNAAQRIAELAALSSFDYEQARSAAAAELGVRTGVLDHEVAKHRTEQKPKGPPKWAAPAQVSDQPVDGPQLLADLTAAIKKFVVLDDTAALIVALWALFTWVFEDTAETNPFLRVIAPAEECGKSTLLKVLKRITRLGWIVAKITPSSFTRSMQRERRSLLLDEGDAFLQENEVMRNVLDGASDPDTASISMSVKSGDDWVPAEFNVFVPIAISSIGILRKMRTVESRSIHIHLKRATAAELTRLLKGRRHELNDVLNPVAEQCARWTADNAGSLKDKRPELPESLSGRDMDKWEPLITIADAISDECGATARRAAIAMCGAKDSESLGTRLLADIRQLFSERSEDKFPSKAMCEELAALEGQPWGEYGKARKRISQGQLGGLLDPFLIKSHSIRLGDKTPKGYERKDFEDAWLRYLVAPKDDRTNSHTPMIGDFDRHTATTAGREGESTDFQSATETLCGGSKNGSLPYGETDCGAVAAEEPDHAQRTSIDPEAERYRRMDAERNDDDRRKRRGSDYE